MKRYLRKKQHLLDEILKSDIKISLEDDIIRLVGTCSSWDDKVKAGFLVAKSGSRIHVVNDIKVSDFEKENINKPVIQDNFLEAESPDVLIIGGGVVGCSIARELTKNKLDILLVEKEYDVATQASSRSDGMIHPGIDIKPGLLKKKYNNHGNALYDQLTKDLEVDFERTGQYLCFESLKHLPLMTASISYFNRTVAGKTHLVMGDELRKLEPGISDRVKFALYFDGTAIVCPFNIAIALAENAIENGAKISLNTIVQSMEIEEYTGSESQGNNSNNGIRKIIKSVTTNRGTIYPKVVINAAGVFADNIAEMAGDRFYSIHPRKGTSLILDKKSKSNINTIYSLMRGHAKRAQSKGGGMVTTVHGNVLVGPDAFETHLKEDYTTEAENIHNIIDKHKQVAPWLNHKNVIAYFSGIRAATYEEDFIVEEGRKTANLIHIAGIQSPGLTAAPALGLAAEKMAIEILSKNQLVEKNKDFNPRRKAIVTVSQLTLEERKKLIENNPDYGKIICRCEEVSKGEILDAMRRPLPCHTLDGIKRRVRPTAGRCQGGFCGPLITKLISEESKIPMEEVCKGYPKSNILFGEKGGVHE
ncbi:NAD(P)/FAD-dependent oxidoreductase [Eubacteriales bacterium KG127]